MFERLNSLRRIAHAGAELLHYFLRRASRLFALAYIERDRTHPRMTTAAVALANLRQIYHWRRRGPGVRSHRNLHPEAALAQPHAIDGFRMQIVRDKFVVAFEIKI